MNTVRNNQVWRDNKAAGTRYIQILNERDENGRVVTATVYRGEAGELPVEIKDASRTSARLDRFNGKHDGYTLVAQTLAEFKDKKLYLVDFVKPESLTSGADQAELGKLVIGGIKSALADHMAPTVDRQAAPGEIWRELEPRYIRYVEVLGEDDSGERNKIVTRYFTEADGEQPELTAAAKATYAKKDRFNGKRKGYEFVAASLSELLSLGVLNEVFSAVGSAAAEETLVEDKAEESVSSNSVSVRQLWQDRQAPLIRLVEVVAVNGGVVEVANRYVQDELDQNPRRVQLDVIEEVSLNTFEDEGRFRFVTAL